MEILTPNIDPRTPALCATRVDDADFRLGYRRWLDGLRGLAILLVLAFHLGLLPGGSLGVDIFFVLSGFLITSLLVEEWQRDHSISLKQFYLRRILRLVPAFAMLLLLFIGKTLLFTPAEEWNARWREVLVVACYVSNYPQIHGVSTTSLGHAWSLSLEEQFYVLWPLLLLLMLRTLSRRQIVTVVIGGILASALLRLALHNQHRLFDSLPIHRMKLYSGLHTRADALLCGCLASLLISWNMLPKSQKFLNGLTTGSFVATGIVAFWLLRRDLLSSQNYNGMFTVIAFSVAVVILRLLLAPSGVMVRVLEWTPLVFVGRISYGLYLFHVEPIEWLCPREAGFNPSGIALATALSFAAALLSFYLVEKPFLRLKDRLHVSKAVAAPMPATTSRAA
jgi:peptidoglycan/LPS O-acetylase OafA/YrhL